MISLVDRNRSKLREGIVCEPTITSIEQTIAHGDNVLVYINRRGAHRAYVCEDCSAVTQCPHCDVSLTLHTSPWSMLLCHHCGHRESLPQACLKCQGVRLKWAGIAIQSVETFMRRIFLDVEILRLDSDTQIKAITKKIPSPNSQPDNLVGTNSPEPSKKGIIYLATEYALRHLTETITLCIAITPEAELAIPEFDIEERVYTHLRALSSITKEIIIETHTPRLTLLEDLLHHNYRDFLIRTLRDRKLFSYPPYMGLAYIEISHKNPSIVDDIALKLTNKLGLTITHKDSTVLYDRGTRMKRAGLTVDTLVLRSTDIHTFLSPVRGEILRNKSVSLSIRGEKILD